MPEDTTKVVTYHRMSDQVYNALEAKLGQLIVTTNTTDLEAGKMLGIQMVLRELRTGYVV